MVSTDISIWLAAFFTIAIFSYAYKDNPIFKFVEHTFVAAAVGNAVVMGVDSIIRIGWNRIMTGELIYFIPFILGIMLYARFHKKYYWLSNYGIATITAIGIGLTLRTSVQTDIVDQLAKIMSPITTIDTAALTFATITTLIYFTFSIQRLHVGRAYIIPTIGRYVLMAALGAAFGNTVLTRMRLLIGRLIFLLSEWLGLF